MSKVIADITMSLDGGHGARPGRLRDPRAGDCGDQCRGDGSAAARCRRRVQWLVKGHGYGAQQVGTPPFFVVTHSPPQDVRLERELGTRFTFVHDLTSAIDQARAAATRWSRRDPGRWGHHREGDRSGPRGRAAPAPRTDAARWRNTALWGGHAPDASPTSRLPFEQRRPPHLRAAHHRRR